MRIGILEGPGTRRGNRLTLTRIALIAVCIGATACVHRAQVWPSPIVAGNQVTAKFTVPRTVGLDDESTLVVREMSGTVVSLRADTLVLRLTAVPDEPSRGRWGRHDAIIPLDSTTTVTRAEFDPSAVALMAVAGISFVYAFIGSLPP